jgi:hypothetical protein
MQMITLRSKGITRPPIKTAVAVACGVGLLLCAGVDSAWAARRTGGAWTSVQRLPQNIGSAGLVRDHRKAGATAVRGGVQVIDSPSARRGPRKWPESSTKRCPGTVWAGQPAACGDHRR